MIDGILDHIASSGPNLLGLIGMFIQERRHQKNQTHQDLIEWLESHRHEELKQLILNTHDLASEVDELLRSDQQVILREIRLLGDCIHQIASTLDDSVGRIAQLANPSAKLSEQAQKILISLAESTAVECMTTFGNSRGGVILCINGRGWDATQPRFVLDDLDALCSCGLIRISSYNSNGKPMYVITRPGYDLATLLAKKTSGTPASAKSSSRLISQLICLKSTRPDKYSEGAVELLCERLAEIISQIGQPKFSRRGVCIDITTICETFTPSVYEEVCMLAARSFFRVTRVDPLIGTQGDQAP